MARVLVVAFEGVQTLDVTGPAEGAATAARLAGRALYRVEIVAVGGGLRETSSGLRLATRDLSQVRPQSSDIVIVAGGSEEPMRVALADEALAAWLRRAAKTAQIMASVCSGAFLLAGAGLLDGRRAATHWSACERLARAFPRVSVDANAIFVTDGKLWTSAGVTTGIDMALAMVERAHGPALADAIAAQLVLYVRRPGFQSQFSEALVTQTGRADSLAPAIAWARANLDRVDVESLARRAGLSLRTLHRRCLETLSTTPARLIEKLRVERARSLLESRDVPSKTLAQSCGFGGTARMNRAFQRELGLLPRAYRVLHAAR